MRCAQPSIALPMNFGPLLFGVEIEGCARCGGKLRIIASIEEPQVIAKILAHLDKAAGEESRPELETLAARAPPAQRRLL